MIRETIDIEALLIRAYREKRIDRFGLEYDRQRRLLGKLIGLSAPRAGGGFNVAERVQTSGYAATLASREGRLWTDLNRTGDSLLTVHDAVLELPTFFLELLGGLDFQVWDAETALRLGHRITVAREGATVQRMRRRGGQDPKRAEELRPAGPERRIQAIEATTFLISHGRAADRPYVPALVVTGRRPIYVGANKRAAVHEPQYETPIAEVVEARAIYATWHACLGMLVKTCAHLADLDVTGPFAPAVPWEETSEVDLQPKRHARSGPGAASDNADAGRREVLI